MTYYPDLTEYSYLPDPPPALTVGWLGVEHAFQTGELPAGIREKLRELVVTRPVNQTRGFHACEFCPPSAEMAPPVAQWKDQSRLLGSAEVWVTSRDGVAYSCPDLIWHYVEVHHYSPPLEFVRALADQGPE